LNSIGGHPLTNQEEWTPVTQVPAIVSQEQFDLVQAKLAHNQQFARRNNTTHDYLLRALVSCGVCHLACTGRSDRGRYAYYTCRGKSSAVISSRDEKCPSRFIPAGQLDELVWQDLCEVLTHPEMIAAALQRVKARTMASSRITSQTRESTESSSQFGASDVTAYRCLLGQCALTRRV